MRPSSYDEFLSKQPALADFTDRVTERTVSYSRLTKKEEFEAEIEKLNSIAQESTVSKPIRLPGLQVAHLDDSSAMRMALACRAVEASLGITPWHHQIVCATLLLRGLIVEMPNGSGKSLAALLAAAFNCSLGYRTHIATANDYLAERDVRELGPAYQMMGFRVGLIFSDQTPAFRFGMLHSDARTLLVQSKGDSGRVEAASETVGLPLAQEQSAEAPRSVRSQNPNLSDTVSEVPALATPKEELQHYPLAAVRLAPELHEKDVFNASIVYGQIEQFGFAFLRDNRQDRLEDQVLRNRDLLIVDECDAVLLDDLRLPIVLTEPSSAPQGGFNLSDLQGLHMLARDLTIQEDFVVRGSQVSFTYEGVDHVRRLTGIDLFGSANPGLALALRNALKAVHVLHERQDYLVRDGQIVIIEQQSGRLLHNRRYSDGLHEALEVKEGVRTEGFRSGSLEIARITIKHFVREYKILSGMSGTIGEEIEYKQFYGLGCARIQPDSLTRIDHRDVVYRTAEEAARATVFLAIDEADKGRPVLVNVASILDIDQITSLLLETSGGNSRFQALDARTANSLGQEAERVGRAGEEGLITICSKVAARGTDIKLDDAAIGYGGLYVIGLKRANERRYDDQLRGRAGRHGQPGDSVFILSLDDELFTIFGGDRIKNLMRRLGMGPDEPIESAVVTRSIESAQRKLQRMNFRLRLSVVEFDDVMARHRVVFYSIRQRLLLKDELWSDVQRIVENWVNQTVVDIQQIRRSAFGARQRHDFLGRIGPHLSDIEIERVFQTRSRRKQKHVLGQTVEAKLKRILENLAESATNTTRKMMLMNLDFQWKDYLQFENASREETELYAASDPTAFEHYVQKMETKFDMFFNEVGERVMLNLLELDDVPYSGR